MLQSNSPNFNKTGQTYKNNINTTSQHKEKKESYNESDFSKLDSKNTNDRYILISSNRTQQLKRINKTPEKNQKTNKQNYKFMISMTLANSKNNYVNFRNPKMHPQISRMSFPYFLEDQLQQLPKKKQQLCPKITNRVFTKKQQKQSIPYNCGKVSNEQPPINQFLCYNLSKQINNGLFEVKVLAEQIKKIKKQKQELLEDKNKYKPMNQIRIAGGGKNIGLGRMLSQSKRLTQKLPT